MSTTFLSTTVFILIFIFKATRANFTLQIGDACGDKLEESKLLRSCDPSIPLECHHGRCQCKRGYTVNRNGTQCLEIARNGLESKCQESIQCWKGLLGRLSECNSSTFVCQCYESEALPIVFYQGRCYYGESLGDYCQITGLCEATTAEATCKSAVCQCRDGWVPSWDKSRCLQIGTQGLDSPCEENVQCEKSQLGTLSECNQDTLKCQCYSIPVVPTVFHLGRCYFGATLGDICQLTQQCLATTENSICGGDGKCRCNETDGYVPNTSGTSCLPIISSDAGDVASTECIEDIQCTRTLGHFARCNQLSRKCECIAPTLNNNSPTTAPYDTITQKPMIIIGAKCTFTMKLRESCTYNQQCSGITPNSACVNGTCQCKFGSYVASSEGSRCLPISSDGLGSTCEENSQCIESILGPLSRCDPITQTCSCWSLLPVVYYNKACFFHRPLGTPCDMDSECQAAGNIQAECRQGKCGCGNGTTRVDHGQDCVPIAAEVISASRAEGQHHLGFVLLPKIFSTYIICLKFYMN